MHWWNLREMNSIRERKKKKKKGGGVKKCICAGCYNRTLDWEVYKQQTFISHNSRGWKSRSGSSMVEWGLSSRLQIFTMSSCGKTGKGLLGVSFIRALIPFMAPFSGLKHLPNTSPPYAITLEGQDFSIWIWGRKHSDHSRKDTERSTEEENPSYVPRFTSYLVAQQPYLSRRNLFAKREQGLNPI